MLGDRHPYRDRWNRWTVQPFLAVRTAVLNDSLADSFRDWFPGFRPKVAELLAVAAHEFLWSQVKKRPPVPTSPGWAKRSRENVLCKAEMAYPSLL